MNPLIIAQWHPTKNNGLDPALISAWSSKKAWWICSEGHEWETRVGSRFKKNGVLSACPYCKGLRTLQGFNDFATTHPILAEEWHPTKNGNLLPSQVGMGSSKRVWWLAACGHEWEVSVGNRSNVKTGTNCPYCSGNKILLGFNDLRTTELLIASQWHPTKNGNLLPENFSSGSEKKIWWVGACAHTWEAAIHKRVEGQGCPVCAGHISLKGFNDLFSSFPLLLKEWHPTKNGSLLPSAITIGSSRKVWWVCSKGHEWETNVSSRIHKTKRTGCPVCGNKKIIIGENDFAALNPILAEEWHSTKNGNLTPQQVTSGSNKKVWWVCSKDSSHEWETTVGARVNNDYSCPKCSNRISKAELEIAEFLISLGLVIEQSNRKVLGGRELDIYIPEKKFAVEFNGLYWHSEDAGKGKSYHYDKWEACMVQGIQLVQVWEDDWKRNPELIKNMLQHKLGLSEQLKVYARKTEVVLLNTAEAQVFLGVNHIQGFASGSYYLGLVGKGDMKTLLALLVLKKEAGSEGKVLNIIRYATAANVVGGFTKLLKHAEKTYSPDSFITFSDHCVSDGGLYKNNGFVAVRELTPDYMYVVNGERKHKFGYRLKRFESDPDLLWDSGLTERELALLNNIPRVWDAGKTCWVRQVSL